MKRAIVSTPSPARRLLNTKGRVPRSLHDRERGADVGREIDFVDHEQVGTRDPRTTFGRNLVAGGDVEDVERQVRELRRKCRGQVVAPGFDQNEIERRKFLLHLRDRGENGSAPTISASIRICTMVANAVSKSRSPLACRMLTC